MTNIMPLIVFGGGIFVLLIFGLTYSIIENKKFHKNSKKWNQIKRGQYSKVDYGGERKSSRSGTMVHTTSNWTEYTTILHFKTGETIRMHGWIEIPYPINTEVIVWQNDNGKYAITTDIDGFDNT